MKQAIVVIFAVVLVVACARTDKPAETKPAGDQPAAAAKATSPEPTNAHPVTDPDEVFTNPRAFDGRPVTLRGVVMAVESSVVFGADGVPKMHSTGSPVCTELRCGPSNPCCNSCTSAATLKVGNLRMVTLPKPHGCSGNECTMKCNPTEGASVEVTGTFRILPNSYTMDVQSIKTL